MRTISAQSITDTVAQLCIKANTQLPQDVQAALEAAKAKAEQLAGVVNEYEIARPTEDTEKMLKISAFDKGTPHKINKEEIEEI